MSDKDIDCVLKENNINKNQYRYYKNAYKYKHFSDDEIIRLIVERKKKRPVKQSVERRKKREIITISQDLSNKLKENNIFRQMYFNNKKRFNDRLSDDEIIQEILDNRCPIKEFLGRYNITVSQYHDFRFAHKECKDLTKREIVDLILQKRENKPVSYKQKCEDLGISYTGFMSYKSDHNIEALDKAFEIYVDYISNRQETLTEKCRKEGVSYSRVSRCKKQNNFTDDEAIAYCKQVISKTEKDKDSLKRVCREAGIEGLYYSSILEYKRLKPDLDNKQLLDWFMQNIFPLYKYCEFCGTTRAGIVNFTKKHPNMSIKDVIRKYKPDTVFNIFGEPIMKG